MSEPKYIILKNGEPDFETSYIWEAVTHVDSVWHELQKQGYDIVTNISIIKHTSRSDSKRTVS